ncbi:cytochrome d ubiquinol oxidase subunit II [Ottowia sp. GY511]|uniref:Cytochrome d ubiquinol oxidase subunit II n=1 Tax=Ottowia flava TaxID=2675430 RepID=A0ABW4KWZ8_9BURK|nr:cytochrome d ubiquinol oxidase subunit II [Ottowia sp. GY511]TXK26857.1 cytochrome d ubiquinol oxidase subunit II [Ottowia sp. GY511]
MNASTWLPVAWFGVIGFGVLMYVLLDGFVLGLGILAPAARDGDQLDHMMNTAAPIWDGNETWLVLGGAGLMAAFPRAYAVVLSALYLPVILMLLALVFRGVAFEFRFKGYGAARRAWGAAFSLGSIVAAFFQGVILGALVQGLPLNNSGYYDGGPFGWLSPFALLTGVALVIGYALLGAGWLILKTEGALHARARQLARPLVLAVLVAMLAVSVSLPFLESRLMARWFSGYNFLWLSPVPIVTLGVAWLLWRDAALATPERPAAHDARPFLWTLALFGLGFIGLVLGMWPLIVPPALSIWDAASPPESQGFVLWGLVVLVPLILGYTGWSYSVFRGKVAADAGYH